MCPTFFEIQVNILFVWNIFWSALIAGMKRTTLDLAKRHFFKFYLKLKFIWNAVLIASTLLEGMNLKHSFNIFNSIFKPNSYHNMQQ